MAKVKYNYLKEDLYTPQHANGALGGITSKGEIVINFFTEVPASPKSQTHEIDGNTIKPEILSEREPKEDSLSINVNRIISTGVILTAPVATELYIWLGTQLEMLKTVQNGSK